MNQDDMRALFDRLWPIPRSITGNGFRESLDIISETVPIDKLEFPSGQKCFDWSVPREWNIRQAYIKDSQGNTLVDFADNTLHVVSYSTPVRGTFSHDELMKHLHTHPNLPDAIPYRTSYYKESWGFCIEHERLDRFADDTYEVLIDSSLEDGSLTIGEGFLQGESDEEILLSCYMCHPAMANNELSGPVALTALYDALQNRKQRHYSYRFVYCPETIGSIVYLSEHYRSLQRKVKAGITFAMVGLDKDLIFRETRNGDTIADRASLNVLKRCQTNADLRKWSPMGGGDQRQYSSLGINLPITYMARAIDGNYPEYHTSLDNMDLISMDRMEETVSIFLDILDTIENNAVFENLHPHCEPQLGKRGLYPTTGGERAQDITRMYIHMLGWSDGKTDLIEISDHCGYSVSDLRAAADTLSEHKLLKQVN